MALPNLLVIGALKSGRHLHRGRVRGQREPHEPAARADRLRLAGLFEYRERIPPLETGVPGLVLANTTQIYPEDRGTNYSVRLADEAVAALLRPRLARPGRAAAGA